MEGVSSTTEWLDSGFFGPVTATLDWCEANYQFSYYIAEMANTFSNLFTIGLALFGGMHAYKQGLPKRYMTGYAGVALVGIGSFAFHATLLFTAQLADELPMIYVASLSLWFLFDIKPGYGVKSAHTKLLIATLVAFDALFTWSYIVNRNPVYHQVVFGLIVFSTAFRVAYLLRQPEIADRVPEATRSQIGKMFATGAGLFAFGFLIWNLDNIFCSEITKWKVYVGWPKAFLLEGHSWWHVFTGAGTYYMCIGIQYLTLCIKDNHRNYTIATGYGLPYLARVESKKPMN